MTPKGRTDADEISRGVVELVQLLRGHVEVLRRRGVTELPVDRPEPGTTAPVVEEARQPEPAVPAAPMDFGRETRLAHLLEQAQQCTRCRLSARRKRTVFGEGSTTATVMFIGEGPGAEEDKTGRPFVGRAGKLLTRMLECAGLERKNVYITNVVKCRPPNNRDPQPDEVASCRAFLQAQIESVSPSIIVTLGRPATQSLLNSTGSLSSLRGRLHSFGGIDLIATYHPAFLLRNPVRKRDSWSDLLLLLDALEKKGLLRHRPAPWWRSW